MQKSHPGHTMILISDHLLAYCSTVDLIAPVQNTALLLSSQRPFFVVLPGDGVISS